MSNAAGQKPTAVEAQDNYQTLIDYGGGTNIIYLGKATAGISATAASWAIKKITYDGNNNPTAIKWASGTDTFDKVWDDRATYSYS